MKTLKDRINEALKIGNNLSEWSAYSCQPKTKDELKDIIKARIKEQGPECDLNDIDVSLIDDMSYLFDRMNFNGDISKWNVSNVINMKLMFNGFENFNCDLSGWDVSNVEDMNSMFSFCKNFKGNGLEKWDVSNVKDMKIMFYNCENFDCDLSNWDVSKVENMYTMFEGCSKFKGKGLENWNVSKVENISYMFFDCINFDCNLSNWNVNDVKNMERMFYNCNLKNTPKWYKE